MRFQENTWGSLYFPPKDKTCIQQYINSLLYLRFLSIFCYCYHNSWRKVSSKWPKIKQKTMIINICNQIITYFLTRHILLLQKTLSHLLKQACHKIRSLMYKNIRENYIFSKKNSRELYWFIWCKEAILI